MQLRLHQILMIKNPYHHHQIDYRPSFKEIFLRNGLG